MPRIGYDGSVLHAFEMVLVNHIDISGERAEDVAERCRFGHGHHPKPIHHRFEGRQRIDLGHNDVGAQSSGAHR